jgi:fluoroacetyl-CoA thioesterase
MAQIHVGLIGEHRCTVTPEIAVDFLGLEGARVLGTPFMIMLIEMTARNSMLPLLDPGFDSVGTDVSVRHLAATPLGMEVRFKTEVIEVEGRRVKFKVEAWDEREQIADGTHERFVVNVERFAQRLAEKKIGRE